MRKVDDGQVAVGGNRVTPAIARVEARRKIPDDRDFGFGHGLLQRAQDKVPFLVGVFLDLVRNLEREQRQSHRAVIRSGGQPIDLGPARQNPPWRTAPESDVVPLAWVPVDFLLIGKILRAAKEEQGADRRLVVAPAREGGDDYPTAAAQIDVVGLGPACPEHGGANLIFRCEQRHVDRVPEQSVAGPGTANEVIRKVDPGQDPMNPGKDQIRQDGPEDYREPQPAPLQRLLKEYRREPDGGHPTEDKQSRVQNGVRVRKPATAPPGAGRQG